MPKRNRNRGWDNEGLGSEPWHFSHVSQWPIANTFSQIQDTQSDDAPYEFEYIEMYDPSVLQASTPQIMPFIRGIHYAVSPYLGASLMNTLAASVAPAVVGNQSNLDQGITVMAAIYDDGGEATLLEVDQIGIADFYATVHHQYITASSVDCAFDFTVSGNSCSVTLQAGWLPSPTLTLAFLPTLAFAADASTFPAGVLCVQGFLEVEWRQVSPSKLRQQALARVFEKGG